MREIFLNYRRADTSGHAGRLTDLLDARFGSGTVFRDVESIDAGTDFVHAIQQAVGRARLMLVLIGNTWATMTTSDGARRLDDPEDFVRIEIATALGQGIPVLPVLVEGARLPAERDLPTDLTPLARVQAVELTEARWRYDTDGLVDTVTRVARIEPGERTEPGYGAGARAARATILEGVWSLPSGSFWTVWKDGTGYRVEETHYDSRQVWRRGMGSLRSEDAIEVDLDPVFEPPGRHQYHYELRLAADGKLLVGTMRETVKGREEPITLARQ
ncbi:MAG: toll/interleukin-1 receptor domain-containing protein [Gammaproteobacteria bacterium]|nr:toll/interleukin-1 receptor domain-containing protein [Gammaproteobacteria bacterium]